MAVFNESIERIYSHDNSFAPGNVGYDSVFKRRSFYEFHVQFSRVTSYSVYQLV